MNNYLCIGTPRIRCMCSRAEVEGLGSGGKGVMGDPGLLLGSMRQKGSRGSFGY